MGNENCEHCGSREMGLFKHLSQENLSKIAECKVSQKKKKGEYLFEEDESINGIYCIKKGVCKLSKLSSNGKDHIVKLVKKGDSLGFRSTICEEPAKLSAVALEDVEVCFISKSEVVNLIANNPQFSMNIMKLICDDLKEANESMVNLAQKNVKERLAIILLSLHDEFGVNRDGSLTIQLSREDLANMIGTARESCIRLLSEFNKNGLIELVGKKIVIKNLTALRKF